MSQHPQSPSGPSASCADVRIDITQLSNEETKTLLVASLDGDPAAMRTLVVGITPVIQLRVARALLRRASQARGRNLRADVEDLVQEVFARLFAHHGRAIRAWDPDKGLSFPRFVSFLAEREVGMIMRRRKRNPWTEDPTSGATLAEISDDVSDQEIRTQSRQLLLRIAERLHERLSPQGRAYFQRLYVEEQSVHEVATAYGTTPGALYTWKNRLIKQVKKLEQQLMNEGPKNA